MEFNPKEIVAKFDRYLADKSLSFSGVVVGGAALVLLDIVDRPTKDFDFLDSVIPAEIAGAAATFAELHHLSKYWFNSGPSDLVRYLPAQWRDELVLLYQGCALQLWTLPRIGLLKAKIWALCDRQRDFDDVIKMSPTNDELQTVKLWLNPLDGNPGWIEHVNNIITILSEELYRV